MSRQLYDLNGEGLRLTLRPDLFQNWTSKNRFNEKSHKKWERTAEIMAKSSGEKLGSLVSPDRGYSNY